MIRLVKVTYLVDKYMGGTYGPYEKLITLDDTLYPSNSDIETRIYKYFDGISDPYEEMLIPTNIEIVEHIV